MTEIGRDDFEHRLEHDLRAAAPQARALFVDEVARRVRAQRVGLRPNRLRLGLALSFSALMIVALGVLGAPGYVAHAANSVVNAATTTFSGGGSSSTTGTGGGATSGADQYAVANGICHRTTGSQFVLALVDAGAHDTHAAHGDIVPAPPWGCQGNTRHIRVPSETTTHVGSASTAKALQPASFPVTVNSTDGSIPHGTVSCFDDLHRFVDSVALDAGGSAVCTTTFPSAVTHQVTAVFKTGDVNKWASSAANLLSVDVAKSTSTVTVVTILTPAPFAAGVTFTATVTGPTGLRTPTGSVQFFDGTTAIGSNATLTSSGTVAFTTDALTAGQHTIKAAYSGDPAYDLGSGTVVQTITAPPPAPADHLIVAPSSTNATAGNPVGLTVTAKDASGNTVPGYTGTVRFSSTDAQAALPADYTFVPGDNGSHSFSATLKKSGVRTIT
ncbi:MAG: hypothetical protein QOH95_1217, partial [Gaiellaceae bacterium]|nr:hypothetical protein [Gaiellaceae bacterium]